MVGWLEPVDGNGKPIQGDAQIRVWTHTDGDGKFRIGPVAVGRYQITALLEPPRKIASEAVEAGAKEIVLHLMPDTR